MTNLYATSTLTVISIVVIYGIITIVRSLMLGKVKSAILGMGSIIDIERLQRFILISAGLIIGVGLTSLDEDFTASSSYALGFLFILLGLLLVSFARYILRSMLYSPLEQMAEYSAEFGKSFVGVRLPLSGSVELQAFTNRFNENVLALAHRLSKTEIQLEKLQRGVSISLNNFSQMSTNLLMLGDMNEQSDDVSDSYSQNLRELQQSSVEFALWHKDLLNNFKILLTDIRGLSDSGNLLAINAAIETSNLQEENPGISTIATKLHDMAKDLEEKQEVLSRYWHEIDEKYNEFNRSVKSSLDENKQIVEKSHSFSEGIARILMDIQVFDDAIRNEVDGIRGNLQDVIHDLPNAF